MPEEAYRIGQGSDIHPLQAGRVLVLGGVEFEDHDGLAGHSDGDCVLHALIDALLGAAALGDIGEHFPDTDPRWKDAASSDMLRQVVEQLQQRDMEIGNIDITVHARSPRLGLKKIQMVTRLVEILVIDPSRINLKAKTDNGLGPVGEGRAIAAEAVVLLKIS